MSLFDQSGGSLEALSCKAALELTQCEVFSLEDIFKRTITGKFFNYVIVRGNR